MNKFIREDGILRPAALPHTLVFGGSGFHGQDLLGRGLLVPGTQEHVAHYVTLPISRTETAVTELLEGGVHQGDIVSCCGVMTKAPNGVPAVHYLFGPGAKPRAESPLKVVFGNTSPDSHLVQELKKQAQIKYLRIIETSRIEHDKKMAYTQGLMHLWLIIVGTTRDETVQKSLIKPWLTPVQTIIDMIHANPFAEEAIIKFFEILAKCDYKINTALQEVISENITDEHLNNFGTPNSERILQYIGQTDNEIIADPEGIAQLRGYLNTNGFSFLKKQVALIRGTSSH